MSKEIFTDEERYKYVSGKFFRCVKPFGIFELGKTYWLEYIGNQVYQGRSDNILNEKTTITDKQLVNNLKPAPLRRYS